MAARSPEEIRRSIAGAFLVEDKYDGIRGQVHKAGERLAIYSSTLDEEVFNMEAYEGAEWVRISDDVAIDEDQRDAVLLDFQTHYHPGMGDSVSETALEQGDEEYDEGEEGQDVGRED